MSQTREAYRHGDLRNSLISSAVRLIEQGGEAAFSLREAARDVGVSANAAYRHFDDKSALLAAAVAGGLERLASRMLKATDRAAERGRQERPAIARFKAVGRAYVADGLLTADRREGAELKAWSIVHGFASLAPAGHSAIPTGRQRIAALE